MKYLDKDGLSHLWSKIKMYISSNYATKSSIPTKTSQLTNDSNYVGQTFVSNKYLAKSGGTMTGATFGYFPATASTMVGNEYNVLLNAGDRLTITQSGTGQLTASQVKGLFDGLLGPMYSADGIDPSNPYVLLIEGINNVHTQTGGIFGWTARYWYPKKYKVEFYGNYNSGAGVKGWYTVRDVENTATKDLIIRIYNEGFSDAITKVRITIYEPEGGAVGANGFRRWGLSEIFFCHPEAISAYQYASVNYANSAGSVAWANVTGKPTIPSAVTESTVSGWGFAKESDIPTIAEIEAIVDRKLEVIENGSY